MGVVLGVFCLWMGVARSFFRSCWGIREIFYDFVVGLLWFRVVLWVLFWVFFFYSVCRVWSGSVYICLGGRRYILFCRFAKFSIRWVMAV